MVLLSLVPALVALLGAAPAGVVTGPDGLGWIGPPIRSLIESVSQPPASGGDDASTAARPSPPVDRADRSADPQAPPGPLASVANVELLVPRQARAAAFHQSGSRRSLKMHRHPSHGELPSRRRGTSPTSAVDIAMPPGVPVTSTVTGTVVEARPYTLYRRTPDLRVIVVPDSNPGVRVVHLHLGNLLVHPGDRVVAGETEIAIEARLLPFRSQIDRVVGRVPHVHVEVTP